MELTLTNLPRRIELDDVLDSGLISMMTQSSVNPEDFYLTGYETICFKRTREFALESVLASVVPFEKDMLIVSNNSDHARLKMLCKYHDVSNRTIEQPHTTEQWEEFVSIVANYKSYSHILFSCDVHSEYEMDQLKKIATLIKDLKIGLIVHCRRQAMELNKVRELNIDYMICNGSGSEISSVVLASRRKLVQIEGISRSYDMDLYNYWQTSLFGRKSFIEPMAI